jgi:hypothetical protein
MRYLLIIWTREAWHLSDDLVALRDHIRPLDAYERWVILDLADGRDAALAIEEGVGPG